SPFNLINDAAYQAWRERKLASQPNGLDDVSVAIADPLSPGDAEISAIRRIVGRTNWVLIRVTDPAALDEEALKGLAAQLGMTRLDKNLCAEDSGVTALTVKEQTGTPYIPYTSRPLSWHTDGYYNAADEQIRGWVLYCRQDAAEGGDNSIMDHEILYILMRDRDPAMIAALMAEDAMTIPANRENGNEIRPDHTGPVFSVDEAGNLHMRYSARKRNIIWKHNAATHAAVAFIDTLFSDPDAPIFHHRLNPGEGIISNNVLHRREGFRDDAVKGKKRLFFRARYYDRIAGTDTQQWEASGT
ncbi:MAG: TauD/TfdA family dioxygenase, partial [Pseudomonadota bacterium]